MEKKANAGQSADLGDPLSRFHADRRAKFERGRAEHGPEWSGHPLGPVADAYDECLDLWNYAEAGKNFGHIDARTARRWQRRALLLGVDIGAVLEQRRGGGA